MAASGTRENRALSVAGHGTRRNSVDSNSGDNKPVKSQRAACTGRRSKRISCSSAAVGAKLCSVVDSKLSVSDAAEPVLLEKQSMYQLLSESASSERDSVCMHADWGPTHAGTSRGSAVTNEAQAQASVRASEKLKSLWKELFDPKSGRHYYHNRLSKATTWTRPSERELMLKIYEGRTVPD